MKQKIRFLLVALLLVALAFPLASCKKEEEQDTRPLVTIMLESGETIKLRLYPEAAPISVENFIKYAEAGFYDGTIFHRIVKDFMIQGGGYSMSEDDRLVYKEPLYEAIKGEFKDNTGVENPLKHTAGVISMARTSVYDSATSQFFICTDMPESQASYLDGKYAAFGRVADTASLNVVRRLAKVKTGLYHDDTLGSFENLPLETVKIATVTVKK